MLGHSLMRLISMSKRKVCVVVTARPSYSRIKTALEMIDKHDDLELQLVVAASALLDRYGCAVNYMIDDGFEVTAKVYNVLEGESPTVAAKTTGLGIIELSTVFDQIKPDIVVTIADRFETIATAIAASYMNIPLAHVQGGEVTGNIDEKVRHSITKLADYHFVASDDAYQRVINLGEEEASVFNTGCPSIDLALEVNKSLKLSFDPFKKYTGVGNSFDISKGYIVVMQHPVTTEYSYSRSQIDITLEAINKLGLPTLWFWPNVDAGSDGTSSGIRAYRERDELNHVHFFKNMLPDDFLELLIHSSVLIGNSSVGIRECAFLGVPVVNIGSRQNKRARGHNVIDIGYDSDELIDAVNTCVNNTRPASSDIYGRGNSGHNIAELLASVELRHHKTITF